MSGGTPARVAIRHRPLIDGFRGLMIAITVGYHLGGWTAPPGGWVGVSGFLVLSGFLITTLLLTEHRRDGRVGFRRFFARRARRLAPALLLVLAGTVAVAAALGGASEFPTLRGDSLATLFYVANWRYVASAQSYFASFNPSPLRHTWSLAIEEQFYLVWPFAVAGLLAVLGRRRLPVLLAAGALASAAWMHHLAASGADLSRAYYGTDTRAQELLVGGLLALFLSAARDGEVVRRAASWIGTAGLAAFTVLWLTLPADRPGPYLWGGFLATAVAGGLVVYGCARTDQGPLAVLLGSRLLRELGLRSYSLYLVHWPVIVFLDERRVDWSPVVLDGARVVIALAVTEVIHRLIERPIHRQEWVLPRPGLALAGGAALTAVLVVALTVVPPGTDPAPPEEGRVVAAANPEATAPGSGTGPDDPEAGGEGRPDPVELGDHVVVLGDSQAWVLLTAVPARFDLRVSGAHHAGCDAVSPRVRAGGVVLEEDDGCDGWPALWGEALAGGADAVVITLGLRQLYDLDVDGERLEVGTAAWEREFRRGVGDALEVIRSSTDAPVLWTEVPCFEWAEAVSQRELADDDRIDAVNDALVAELAEAPAATLIPYRSEVCDGPDDTESDDELRPDGAHLTPEAAEAWWWSLVPRVRTAQRAAAEG